MPTYAALRAAARSTLLPVGIIIGVHTLALPLVAQPAMSAVELIASADRESAEHRSGAALGLYERALQLDGRSGAALMGASREAVDLGEFEPNASVRSGLYARATDYARRAVAAEPTSADAHFHVARALGRTALALGPRERVKYAVEVRDEALRALALAPKHPGGLHVLGVWNAEVLRLNGFERLFAKTFLGGRVFGSASWPDAVRYIDAAVSADPDRLVHRLDQARIYRDAGRKDEARAAYEAALKAPTRDANDPRYREMAGTELRALSGNGRV